jgi:hypothetical protein
MSRVSSVVELGGWRRGVRWLVGTCAGLTVAASAGQTKAGPADPVVAGSFTTTAPGPTPVQNEWFDEGLPNDVPVCYRARVARDAAVSGWSETVCTTPRVDPVPPVVEPKVTRSTIRSRELSIDLMLSDPMQHDDSRPLEVACGVVPTGVSELRISTSPTFAGATWTAAQSQITVRLPDTDIGGVWIQARDRAGNESSPVALWLELAARTRVDEAIRLEERAQDRMAGGQYTAARSLVDQSMAKVRVSLAAAVKRIAQPPHPPSQKDLHVVKVLTRVWALKAKARGLMKACTAPLATAALAEAPEAERELASWAEQHGVAL